MEHPLARAVRDVLGTGRQTRAAVVAAQQIHVGEPVDVAADGLWRDVEVRSQIVDRDEAVALHPLQQFLLTCVQREAGVSCHGVFCERRTGSGQRLAWPYCKTFVAFVVARGGHWIFSRV